MRVFVENLQFLGRHGLYEEERVDGRTFRVDLAATLPEWAARDDIGETLDYRGLADIVLEVAESDSVNLIETLGRHIVDRVFDRYADVAAVELTIRKRATGVGGDPEWVGVSLDSTRDAWQGRQGAV